jgi:uncharacterized protein
MDTMVLGRTGLTVSRCGFGALPIQRAGMDEARAILRAAFDAGIDFFDTARAYSDSEEKLGAALSDVRDRITLATKSFATTPAELFSHLETSLRSLRTDHVDILQLHNPAALPDPADPNGLYAALKEAQRRGMTRFIGMTSHRRDVALAAARSGLYDTVQFPFNHLSSKEDVGLVEECGGLNVGFIAMKALSGGMVSNVPATFAFIRQFPGVLPIWGIQRMSELQEFIGLEARPPAMDERMRAVIEQDRRELAADFCRGCGYCLPCPAQIPIPMAARLSFALRRMPWRQFVTPEWKAQMGRIRECQDCGHCREHCPYGLDTPSILKRMLADYERFLAEHAEA